MNKAKTRRGRSTGNMDVPAPFLGGWRDVDAELLADNSRGDFHFRYWLDNAENAQIRSITHADVESGSTDDPPKKISAEAIERIRSVLRGALRSKVETLQNILKGTIDREMGQLVAAERPSQNIGQVKHANADQRLGSV